ncbi:SNF2 helicase associated domain-containing protein [Virgibacillus flavescens]|uniref:DEAD/DEAH box helicase n=1 Tax=Virgibacillus flavescens TaxID=1611422 RepID=UPI003D34138F
MNIKLNPEIIEKMCGAVSFKRGDSFYRSNKVTVEEYSQEYCSATVKGKEDFQVAIEVTSDGAFNTSCSCPSLPSFKQNCQHIAAVLITIWNKQRQELNTNSKNEMSNGLFTLFQDNPKRPTAHQLHFENRQVLDAVFTCFPVSIGEGRHLFGIQLDLEGITVLNIRDFLKHAQEVLPIALSDSFTYNPDLHCFLNETDAVIQKLIHIVFDEEIYNDSEHKKGPAENDQTLVLPPSYLDQTLSILKHAPSVKIRQEGENYDGLHLSEEALPLNFKFEETADKGFQLTIDGFNQIVRMEASPFVLTDGKFIQLKKEDERRLNELAKMIAATGKNQLPISQDQVGLFLEKVVPSLKRLGTVTLSESISDQKSKNPLLAKLYLDRVNNRLLAGLEFHYGNTMINPLESHAPQGGTVLFRDTEKEETILKLMESLAQTEGGYFLHNEELEYDFLHHIVPKLHELTRVYATTAVRNRIFKSNSFPRIRVSFKKERTNWLEFKFEMDGIPEKEIPELLEAIEEKRKYFRVGNGALFSLETREIEEINRFMHALPVQHNDLEKGLDVPIVRGLQLLDSTADGNLFNIEESFRQFLEEIRNPDKLEFPVPADLEPVLRGYQKQGYTWMKKLASYGFGGILADDMGLGKTLQSITFMLSELPAIRETKQSVLIVCPSSVTYNWLSEIIKFAPELKAVVADGNKADRIAILNHLKDKDVVITSYPLVRTDIKWYEKQRFHTVFFDEAQAFKNPGTQTARSVKKIQATNRFALTGTPVENSTEELWSIFHVVFPELFQGLKAYSNLTKKQISRRIHPFLLRRLKEDVLTELPNKIESLDSVELLPAQKKLYAAYLAKLRHDTFKHLDKQTLKKNRIKILAGLTRLRQICCHPSLFVDGYKGSSAKFIKLMQIIEEARTAGRRVLIFSQFTKMLEIIGKDLTAQGQNFFYLDGETPAKERVARCNRFNEGERNIFLISLKAGGTGLNLTGADTVILYDLWWNPAVEEQAADRAHRIGQTNTVHVIKLVTRGTIEGKMNELQERKKDLVDEIIGSKGNATSLTDEDIKEILMI